MECKFPEVKPTTAYNKGCRCQRCRSKKKELNKKSACRPWEERSPGMQKMYPVPVDPIRALVENWISKHCRTGEMDSFEGLAQELNMQPRTAERMVYRLRNRETSFMSFRQADKIITALYGVHYWYENEDLHAIYEEHA